jgi:endoglycosylceramidase
MMRTTRLLVLALALLFLGAPLRAATAWIRDAEGRSLILHGANIANAAKRAPDRTSWHTFEDYRRMRDEWGFNVIRLLIFWDGVEPQPGEYDQEYLDRVEERVGWAEELGLYVILDMHQDLYSTKFTGDGAPEWAVWDDGLPFDPVTPWWLNYLSPAVMRAFTNLWTEPALQYFYIAMWTHVAERFAGWPNVLGFDLMNEPFFGEILPWEFEAGYLAPFYLDLIDSLQEAAPGKLCFYEPLVITSAGFRSLLGVLPRENLVYFPHFYQPNVHEGLPYDGNPWLIDLAMERRDREATAAGIPWLLGEFGAAAELEGLEDYLLDLLGRLDRLRAGWTVWSYDRGGGFSILDSSGGENAQLQYLVRPYAQRIPGRPLDLGYLPERRIAYVYYEQDPEVTAPLVFWIGASRIYPEGFELLCSDPSGTWTWEYDEVTGLARIWTDPARPRHWVCVLPAGAEELVQAR